MINNQITRGKEKGARHRLLFAAFALGQQPADTAIKDPIPADLYVIEFS
jgi:hypothetical protein